jgi:diguanylate cyclase (GGDEF)-like protein
MDVRANDAERRAIRLGVARRNVAELLLWAGGLTLVFGVVNLVAIPDASGRTIAINLVFGPLFLLLSWLIRRGLVADRAVPWIWAVSALVLVVMLVGVFSASSTPANLAYVVAVMTAFGPMTNAWPPYFAASAGMLLAAAIEFARSPTVVFVESFLVCAAAVLISGLLLRLRMSALDALADAQARLDDQATSDPLTHVLNRHGLERAIPGLTASAQRAGTRVLVWFLDVRSLKAANDTHGHEFGDAVIQAVARALVASVRVNDAVARWGGDEFVVMGFGDHGSAEELGERVNALLRDDATVNGRWPVEVTVGFASGQPGDDVHLVISEADADMYRHRESA